MDTQDRRVGRRLMVSIPCKFTVMDREHQGRVKNLAIDGAFIEAEDCPLSGGQGNLEFQGTDGQELKITARVVHRSTLSGRSDETRGFGLYFVGFEGDSLVSLKELLEDLTITQGG